MANHRLPYNVRLCVERSLEALTLRQRHSDDVQKAFDDPNMDIYLRTWVIPNLETILKWDDAEIQSADIAVMGR